MNVSQEAQFVGHNAAIYCLAPGFDQRTFFSASGEGWVVRWDLDKPDLGKLVAQVEGQLFKMLTVPNAKALLLGAFDGSLYWVEPDNPKATRRIVHHSNGIFDMVLIDQWLFTVGGDGMLTKWQFPELKPVASIQPTNVGLRSIAYHEPSGRLIVGAGNGKIYQVRAETMELIQSDWEAHDKTVFDILVLNGGDHILTGGRDAQLNLWDWHDLEQVAKNVPAHWYTVNRMAPIPELDLLVSASRDKTIKIWQLSELKLLKVIESVRDNGHVNSVNDILVLPNQEGFITCSDDRSIRWWRLNH